MDLGIIRELNIDLHDSKYIQVNAKQYDRESRYVLITCYNKNTIFPLSSENNHAYIRYRKVDDLGVFNSCQITDEGKILVELTEQMLALAGKCYGDLVIVHNDPTIDDGSIMSTMVFCVNVIAPALDNRDIESSNEYNALNELLIKATTDYNYVMVACKASEDNAKESEINAKASEQNVLTSEQNAKASEEAAKSSEENAKVSEQNALKSETNAKSSEETAKTSANTAVEKATDASNSATLAKSYAVGGTNTRTDENTDNAKYYYNQTKLTCDSLGGTFYPIGTISFSELQSAEKNAGYVYHINDAFITDDTFKCGAGVSYPAGTNVYCTYDGYWDCFTGETFVVIDGYAKFSVVDDNNGNVTLELSSSPTADKSVNQIVEELQERVKILEEQTVLGVVE